MYKTKLFLFGVISAAVLILSLTVVSVSAYITKENLRQSSTAQLLLSEHQMLSSISYRLFKQLTDELIFGRNANQAEVRNKLEMIEQSLETIRRVEIRQRHELGKEVTLGSVEDTDKLESIIFESVEEFNAIIAMNDSTPLHKQERLKRLMEFTIDNKFRETINAAVSRQGKVVAQINARIEALNSAIVWFGIILCLLVTPFIIFGCFWLFNQLYQPLSVITSGTHVIASGNYEYRLPENLDEEFRSLVQSLNQLAGKMAEHQQQENIMRQQLRHEVDQRTYELTEANQQLTLVDQRRKQFIADISHELRTPLTIIRGEAQVTLRQTDPAIGDFRTALKTILDQVIGLSVLVDDLLLLARAEVSQIRLFHGDIVITDFLKAIVEQWQRKIPLRDFRLSFDENSDESLKINADEQRLRQVMTILIDNATRYSDSDKPIDISLSVEQEKIIVSVRDYGSGISPSDLQYVFERFVRFKPRTDGAGLGLSIARVLIEAHKGEMSAQSELGEGSIFMFTIPRPEYA